MKAKPIQPIQPTQPTEELLAQANADNLAYTEQALSNVALLLYGVPIALPFSYELIQIVNHAYLASLLGESKSDVNV